MLRPFLSIAVASLLVGACTQAPTTPYPELDAPVIGGRTLLEARGAPNHVGASGQPFKLFVPCGEARYVGFTARLGGLGAAITAAVVGTKVAQVRVDYLDAEGQSVWQRRYDVPSTGVLLEPRASYAELDNGKGRPGRGDFFLRITGESPHCRGLEVAVTLRN